MITRINIPKVAPRRVTFVMNNTAHFHYYMNWDFLWNLPKISRILCSGNHEFRRVK